MLKLNSLRAVIAQCVPDLARDPERLIVTGDNGRLVATGTASLSFVYHYTATITVLDYTGHADALMVPILAWVKAHQPELLSNPQKRESAIRFKVEPLNTKAVDIGIQIELTEDAIVKADADHPTRVRITHPDEPGPIALAGPDGQQVVQTEHWELWFADKKLAEWDLLPPAFNERFGL